jgi:hypothetical protein
MEHENGLAIVRDASLPTERIEWESRETREAWARERELGRLPPTTYHRKDQTFARMRIAYFRTRVTQMELKSYIVLIRRESLQKLTSEFDITVRRIEKTEPDHIALSILVTTNACAWIATPEIPGDRFCLFFKFDHRLLHAPTSFLFLSSLV